MTDILEHITRAQPEAATGVFPTIRPRRLRRTAALRSLVRETVLTPTDFIEPFFVVDGRDVASPIGSMPGVSQLSIDRLIPLVKEAASAHIPAIILFGIPDEKDDVGSGAYAADGIVQRAV